MFDVRRIANAVLAFGRKRDFELTNMSVNKLTYFSHGWHLALKGQPLVNSPFEAWQHGPVHPILYRQFKSFGAGPVEGCATKIDIETGRPVVVDHLLPVDISEHVEKIVEFYGHLDAGILSSISHEPGAPWDRVWKTTGSTPGMIIPDEFTRDYYQHKLKRRN